MFLLLIVFNTNSVCTNHNIIIIDKSRQLCIFSKKLNIERCAVFNWKNLEVDFSKDINIPIIDLTINYFKRSLLRFLHNCVDITIKIDILISLIINLNEHISKGIFIKAVILKKKAALVIYIKKQKSKQIRKYRS